MTKACWRSAPDFAAITPELFVPAFEQGVAEAAADIARIVADPASPTFANTLEALERAEARLSRVRLLHVM